MMKSSFISSAAQGTINWRASSNPDFIQNYFLFNFDVRLFLIIAINAVNQATYIHFLHFYGSCRSFCKQKQHFSLSISLSLSLSRSPISSHFLLGSPLPPIPDPRIAQLMVPCCSPGFKTKQGCSIHQRNCDEAH